MLALNTQRFATVLTHQLTCFSHAGYHFCVTVYQSDVKSELQSVCKENLKFTGFTHFSQTLPKLTHPLACIVHEEYHYCVTVFRSDVQSELQSVYKLNTYGFHFFFSRKHINQILTHPSTCYSHAEYHYCVTVFRSDVQCELQSDYNFNTCGF